VDMASNEEKRLAIEKIAKEHGAPGKPQPQWVVDAARDKDHILHNEFCWDDKEAANKHRLDQARRLISVIWLDIKYSTVTFGAPKYVGGEAKARAFVEDPDKPGSHQGYVSTFLLAKNPNSSKRALEERAQYIAAMVRNGRILADQLNQSKFFEKLLQEILSLETVS
jgi:hypothetical protein